MILRTFPTGAAFAPACWLAVSGCTLTAGEPARDYASFAMVTVGVADLDEALRLWHGHLGFEVLQRSAGPDGGLAMLWEIDPADVSRQAVLRGPGRNDAMLHLVEFRDPEPPVRRGAQAFDHCPKNLDIYVRDMPERMAELRAAGYTFRNERYSEVTAPNGVRFREIHMPAHDDVNVVLLELLDEPIAFNDRGYAGLGPLITIVPDAAAEQAFYRELFALTKLSDNVLEGPEIEKMIGLPPGAALDVSIWGADGEHFGQIEIIEYRGTDGANLYPKARAKATGILQLRYRAAGLEWLERRLARLGVAFERLSGVTTLGARTDVLVFRSPAGLRIEVHRAVGDG